MPPPIAEHTQSILIIDDSPAVIRVLTLLLQEHAEILFATTGEEGLEIARVRQPDVILLDMQMPTMQGLEVCRALKRDPDTATSAVLFVTANHSDEVEVESLQAGAVDFIAKPLNPPVVRARVLTHLTLQKQAQTLRRFADYDGLTGLLNRRFFDQQLETEFLRHRRQQHELGLAMIDIDHFKRYNDGYGHQAGDDCLKAVAAALDEATRRPGEVVARFGGEEFVVIVPHTSQAELEKYGVWICECVRKLSVPHAHSPTRDIVTISVGLATMLPTGDDTIRQLILSADQALYRAKAQGRDQSVLALG